MRLIRPAGQPEQHHDRARAPHGAGYAEDEGLGEGDVGGHDQAVAAGQRIDDAAGEPAAAAGFRARVDPRVEGHPDRRGHRPVALGRRDQRAADAAPRRVLQHVEERPVVGGGVGDATQQGRFSACPIDRLERVRLLQHRPVRDAGDLAGGGEVDVGQERPGRGCEQQNEQQRQSKRGGAEERRQAHGLAVEAVAGAPHGG